MADGIRCKHCGWQKSSHELLDVRQEVDLDEAKKRLPHRRMTLIQCVDSHGFEAPKSTQRTSRQQEQFEEECLDRQARGMVAWGAYGAYCRQAQFNKTIKEKEKAIRQAGSEEGRKLAKRERDSFVTAAKNANGVLHIGPF